MSEFFQKELFRFGNYDITLGNVILASLLFLLLAALYRLVFYSLAPAYFNRVNLDVGSRKKLKGILRLLFLFLLLLALVLSLTVDYRLVESDEVVLRISHVLGGFMLLQAARLVDFVISRAIALSYDAQQKELKPGQQAPPPNLKKSANRTVQWIVYVLALWLALKSFGFDYRLFEFQSKGNSYAFHISNILIALFILLAARLASWLLTQLVLNSYYRRNNINVGSQFAINQLLKYFLYVIAILMALETLGVTLTVLWGGAAALLVGIGLGLQETFKDFFSGIILLFERTVEVGDVVVVDDLVGTVRRIGLRTSLVETRDNLTVIVPNSRLVVEKVINWSHNDSKARFLVKVGVAYGSDTALVKKLLLNVARENAFVLRHPAPFVRFIDFGESSLDFELHFWTHEFIRIEDIKSDMRFEIDQTFRDNQVTIPFPQRDVWMRDKG
ncbi:MAG: mechanosensitive ion channel [Lewinellaceae bacterium]|nr:mechanosensitive ion channel [Lewinellaceae bacterium]